jgi:hypothetical protein
MPARVAAAGWLSIAAGIVKGVTLTLYLQSMGAGLERAPEVSAALSSDMSWPARAASLASRRLDALAAFWVALGVFMVFAGASLLLRRSWARLGLEGVCWFGLFEAPLAAVFLCLTGRTLSTYEMAQAGGLAAQVFTGIWICAGWLAVYGLLLALLKGEAVRSWLAAEAGR